MGSVLLLNMASLSGCAGGNDTDPVDSPPTASFTHSPASPAAGSVVQFTDTSTRNPTSWQWNFGDGATSNAQNPSHSFMTTGSYMVTLTANNSFGSNSASRPVTVLTPYSIIVDHNCTKLANIPSEWIRLAKQTLHIAYGTASHGTQLWYGATCLNAWDGSGLYAFNNGGSGGALDWRWWGPPGAFGNLGISISIELLAPNGTYDPTRSVWVSSTRTYLDAHPEVNVCMWAWCYGVATSESNINLYLSQMETLEAEYPYVKFVYQTGHSDGSGLTGLTHLRNQQIRNYCIAHNKILYDFYDIECYDPSGNYFGDKNVSADCSYTGGNWAIEWQAAHPGEWFACANCVDVHAPALNCNVKAIAAWNLWARLAGWDGN